LSSSASCTTTPAGSTPIATWISGIDLNNVGFIVGLFIATWAVALTYWRLARVEERWTPLPATEPESS
jgi:high-affinity nickel-transport protein